MKKLLLTLVLTLSVFTASAQIQRTFFGCTLGQTSLNDAISIMRNNNKPLRQKTYDRYEYSTEYSFQFGGVPWTSVTFIFYNNTLCQVFFVETETSGIQESNYNYLYNKFQKKYAQYAMPEFVVKGTLQGVLNGAMYVDNKTSILYTRDYKSLNLTYMDIKMNALRMQNQ